MNDRGGKRGGGVPFYAPPRRKTSAEIISEARAAVYGEMSSAGSGASSGGGGTGNGALRPLRTRRPFTPRDPQRTLFTDRVRRRETRPPSAFNLKYLNLSENSNSSTDMLVATGAGIASMDEPSFNGLLLTETQGNAKKKTLLKSKTISFQETSWGGFPKLPHLSGHSKPLHRRRHDLGAADEFRNEPELAAAISVTQPLGTSVDVFEQINKSRSAESANAKRRQFGVKSLSQDTEHKRNDKLGGIAVKHLAVQLPNTSVTDDFGSMSTLELAESLCQRNFYDTDRILTLLETLQASLERTPPASSLRDLVLRALYTHVDNDDERVLVAISRAMLTMRVVGTHLAAACKLVFKVARNDKNDHFFRSTNLLDLLVEGCGRACPLSEGECCVYGAGALRFLALEPRLRTLAHRAGALHLAALHLKLLNTAKVENPRSVTDQSIHALYQLTGALRNLAGGGERELKVFVASGALAELLAALQLFVTDRDVLTNVVRCLSVLSADEACCSWLCASSNSARTLLTVLATCASRAPLAVRLAYTLGNMAAADEHARLNIYGEEGGIDVLLTILETYNKRTDKDVRDPDVDPDLHLVGSDLGGSDGSCEDVLIKTVRVVANLCLCERAGRGLAASHAERTIRALLGCLEVADSDKRQQDMKMLQILEDETNSESDRREELATAALATLNNITYYREPPAPPDPLDLLLDQLCKVTCGWLVGSGTAACEAVRALGNLSRATRTADLIMSGGALQMLTPFLHHEEATVRCASAGVLVNICGAGGGGGGGGEAAGAAAGALAGAAAIGDAVTAALLARALWNAHAHAPLPSAHAQQAEAALAHFIDDESVFAACEALRTTDRRASDTDLSKHHVKFDLDNNNYSEQDIEENYFIESRPPLMKAYSVDRELNLDNGSEDEDHDRTACSGEDLGFEEGDLVEDDSCECGPCRRLAAWEELVGVAIPLLEKLRPARADASVGTE